MRQGNTMARGLSLSTKVVKKRDKHMQSSCQKSQIETISYITHKKLTRNNQRVILIIKPDTINLLKENGEIAP